MPVLQLSAARLFKSLREGRNTKVLQIHTVTHVYTCSYMPIAVLSLVCFPSISIKYIVQLLCEFLAFGVQLLMLRALPGFLQNY